MKNTEFENLKFRYKISVIGDARVGKNTLMRKFTKGTFDKQYVKTIGVEFSIHDKIIRGDEIRLIFWNIASQDEFHFLRPSFFKESFAAIIVISLEENELGKQSFEHIEKWSENIRKYCGDVPLFLFANKVDLIDNNNLNDINLQVVTIKYNFTNYYKTSIRNGRNVIQAFDEIAELLYNKSIELLKRINN